MASAVPPTSPKITSVLFVCMGNICRSPALEAVFLQCIKEKGIADRFHVSSCGLTAWYLGQPADARTVRAAAKRGIQVDSRAKLFETFYYDLFDLIIAVDHEVLTLLQENASNDTQRAKIHLAGEFSRRFPNQEILDPFYGGPDGFEKTMDMAEDIADGIFSSQKII